MPAPDFGFKVAPSHGDFLPKFLPADERQKIVFDAKQLPTDVSVADRFVACSIFCFQVVDADISSLICDCLMC
jgi:hypothetical protein